MLRTAFLEKVLGDRGYYCLFAVPPKKFVADKPKPKQKFFDSIAALTAAADKVNKQGYNAFFAVQTYAESTQRLPSNLLQMKSLYLDIDCGDGKPYETQRDATLALRKFCINNKLPKPAMINSGRGVHAYWIFEETVTPSEWKALAEQLKKMCVAQDFYIDAGVTADAVRVMRMPDTFNYKFEKEDVKSSVVFTQAGIPLTSYDIMVDKLGVNSLEAAPELVLSAGAEQFLNSAANNRLSQNKESVFQVIADKSLHGDTGCAQIKYRIEEQQNLSEPEWRGILSIATFCSDRETAIHDVSRHHPQYSADETEQKASLIPKPHLCDTLRLEGDKPSLCDGCPHRNKIKTPIVLGMQLKEAEVEDGHYKIDPEPEPEPEPEEVEDTVSSLPVVPKRQYPIPVYPSPYMRGAAGGVYLRTYEEDGETGEKVAVDDCIYRYDIYPVQRIFDSLDGEKTVIRLHLPKDGVREFNVPTVQLTGLNTFREALSKQGVTLMNFAKLQRYFMDWINKLQETDGADESYNQFGWVDKECTAFLLGDKKITADGVGYNPPHSQTEALFPIFEPRGTLQGWQDAISLWADPKFVLQQYGLGIGFGSILMQTTNVRGASVHFYHKDSGVGKTAILEALSSIWGDPEGLVLGKEDKPLFKLNRAELYKNLPLPIDEITNMDGKDASEMLYQITGGKQRGRMQSSANIERQRGNSWALMAATTGNSSILQRISGYKKGARPEAQRVLEVRVPRLFHKTRDKHITDKFDAGIKSNYGHAGIVFVQYVIKNSAQVTKLVNTIMAKVDKDAELTNENRFWSAQVSTDIAALIIANRIGLIPFSVDHVYKWAVSVLLPANKNGVELEKQSAEDIINDYFSDNLSDILVVDAGDAINPALGNGDPNNLQHVQREVRMRLAGRYEPDTQKLYLKPSTFRKWCTDNQIDSSGLWEQLVKLGKARNKKNFRFFKGTTLRDVGIGPALEVDFSPAVESDDKET